MTRQEIRAPGMVEPISHYTDAVRAGEFLFLSGCVSFDEHGNVVAPGDITGQTHQVLRNIGTVLKASGADFSDIVRLGIYLTNIVDRKTVSDIRRPYFGSTTPTTLLVEVAGLVLPELVIEIEATAYLPHDSEVRSTPSS